MQRRDYAKRLVLIGGGHAHALFLAQCAKRSIQGLKITLIDVQEVAPYTGMLPGFIAGHYAADDLTINLSALAKRSGADFIASPVVEFRTDTQEVVCADGRRVAYDSASFDIGIHSQLASIPGYAEHTVPAKPLQTYAEAWQHYVDTLSVTADIAPVTVVGGGVAGVELALAMQYRLHQHGVSSPVVQIIEAGELLRGVSARARTLLLRELKYHNISIYEQSAVSRFTEDGLVLADGTTLPSGFTVTAAGAQPYQWLQDTDLPLTNGYISITNTLQTTTYENVFAVGDCAHFTPRPLPKAGVYAVRQSPVLYANIRALYEARLLSIFRPQSSYLKLISLGDRRALADKYIVPITGHLVWHLKDYIDRSFMRQF